MAAAYLCGPWLVLPGARGGLRLHVTRGFLAPFAPVGLQVNTGRPLNMVDLQTTGQDESRATLEEQTQSSQSSSAHRVSLGLHGKFAPCAEADAVADWASSAEAAWLSAQHCE